PAPGARSSGRRLPATLHRLRRTPRSRRLLIPIAMPCGARYRFIARSVSSMADDASRRIYSRDSMTADKDRRTEVGGRRDAPLAMSADAFRQAGHTLVDRIADRLAAIPRHPVTRDDSPAAVRAALGLGGPLPEEGGDAGALLAAADALFDHSLFNAHPRF